MQQKVICVIGPTASGKTELAVRMALQLNAEVVSCDSMQIYRGMDIGTAKPTPEEMRGVPHHMLDVAEPDEPYSVSRYVEEATAAVEDILSRGRAVIIAGGTGLYADALVRGLDFSSGPGSGTIRVRLETLYDRYGAARLHRLLEELDAAAAAKLHPNDKRRVVRALEVLFSEGRRISDHDAETRARLPRYEALWIGLTYRDRAQLYGRIDRRVDQMLAAGLREEAERLASAGFHRTATQAIGYKEFWAEGERAAERIKQATRRYAKRQLTWFRRDPAIRWLFRDEMTMDAIVQHSTEMARVFLYN